MLRLLDWVLDLILKHPLIFWACMAANVVGVVWGGWIWYGPQLAQSPPWAWLFIPDCPLAALWATVAFIGLRYGRSWGWFNAFAAFACIKYGLWTIAFWLRHWSEAGFVPGFWPMEAMLFVSHIGLACEGVLLATCIGPLGLGRRLAVVGWYALSIVVDYAVRLPGVPPFHPPLTYAVPEGFVIAVAAGLTAALGAALLLLPAPRRSAGLGEPAPAPQ